MANRLKDIKAAMIARMPHGYRDDLPWSNMINEAADAILTVVSKELEVVWLISEAQDAKIQELETQILFMRTRTDLIK